MADEGDPGRFVSDMENDMAILIGPEADRKFIGMGLLANLHVQGFTDDQVASWLSPGETVMTEAQLKGRRSPKG